SFCTPGRPTTYAELRLENDWVRRNLITGHSADQPPLFAVPGRSTTRWDLSDPDEAILSRHEGAKQLHRSIERRNAASGSFLNNRNPARSCARPDAGSIASARSTK